jgi:hypothetical protein
MLDLLERRLSGEESATETRPTVLHLPAFGSTRGRVMKSVWDELWSPERTKARIEVGWIMTSR